MSTEKRQASRSLTTTLAIAFFSLSVVVLLISNGLQLFSNIQTQQAAISREQQYIAQGAAITVSNFIEEKSDVLSTVGWQVNPNEVSSQVQIQSLTSLLVRQKDFQQLVFFDAQNNETAYATRAQGNSAATYARFISLVTSNILAQVKNGQRYISSVYFDKFTGAPLVTIVVPATDALGNFRGTLAAELNLISIWRLVNELKAGETGYVYVVDSQGNLIAFRETNRVLEGENVSQISAVKEFIESSETPANIIPDVKTYPGLLGTKVLGIYVPLSTPEWAVVIELPFSEAYSPIVQSIIGSVTVILLMAVLAGIAGLMVALRLAVPLVDLTGTASRIASGEMQLQATVGGAREIASLGVAFNTMTSQLRELIGSLEQRVAERTDELERANQQIERRAEQFEAIAQVSRIISSIQDQEELLPHITRMISQYFGFYHVGIFLLDDDNHYAILRAANSEGGKRMLKRKHRLEVGQTGIVGYVTSTGNPRVALDTGTDAVYFDNPDLPETHSEMALPLKAGGRVVGALDVQSTEPNAFTPEDVNILSTMADQVSSAIQNARLYEESREAQAQAEAVSRQLTGQAWTNIQRFTPLVGYHFDGIKPEPLTQPINSEQAESQKEAYSVPVRLRGESIGRLRIKSAADGHQWTEDEIAIIRATTERVALAVENARLILESQKNAAKEQVIGEISSKIGAAINLDNILQTTLREMGRIMPGAEISIQVENE